MANADTWLDFSERERDLLGRWSAVEALRHMLAADDLMTPLALGVYGGWGVGKTSVMRTLQTALKGPDRLILWFDSWVYARQEEALWRALLLRVVEALRARTTHPDELNLQGQAYDESKRDFDALWLNLEDAQKAKTELDEASASLYRSLAFTQKGGVSFNWAGALPLAVDATLTAITAGLSTQIATAIAGKDGPTGPVAAIAKWLKGGDTKEMVRLFEREATDRYIEQVGSLEQFQATFRKLISRFGIGDKRRLFIFVDDLDRCLPEDAVAALEAIKLFLDIPGCVFVLGMDRAVVEQGINVRYKDLREAGFDSRAYLDKVIQVPFNLPPLARAQLDDFLQQISGPNGLAQCRGLIRRAAPPNPRTLKRVLNALMLTLYLDGYDDNSLTCPNQGDTVHIQQLAKLVLLQVCFEPIWKILATGATTVKEVERYCIDRSSPVAENVKELIAIEGSRLTALFVTEPRFAELNEEEIASLFAVTKITARTPG